MRIRRQHGRRHQEARHVDPASAKIGDRLLEIASRSPSTGMPRIAWARSLRAEATWDADRLDLAHRASSIALQQHLGVGVARPSTSVGMVSAALA